MFYVLEDDNLAYISEDKDEIIETIENLLAPYFSNEEIADEIESIDYQVDMVGLAHGFASGFIVHRF